MSFNIIKKKFLRKKRKTFKNERDGYYEGKCVNMRKMHLFFKKMVAAAVILLLVPITAFASDGYNYHYPEDTSKPYYQMSMYSFKEKTSDPGNSPTGIFRLLNTDANNEVSYAYCADSQVYDEWGYNYKLVPLDDCDTTQTHAENLRAIINHAYPFISQEKMIEEMKTDGVTLHNATIPCYEMVLISAVQQAIYSFTNENVPIEQPFAGAISYADYESYYKDLVFDFNEAYGSVDTQPEHVGEDVVAIIDWLNQLQEESAPAGPDQDDLSFKAEIVADNNQYVLKMTDFSEEMKKVGDLKVTVTVDGTEVLKDQPISIDSSGKSEISIPNYIDGQTATVTIDGVQTYDDVVAYVSEEKEDEQSQNFIGRQTLSREISCTEAAEKIAPAIKIVPADLTIYMGGDDGYGSVVDGAGDVTDTTSLPRPLFYIQAPAGVDASELVFTSTDKVPDTEDAKQWSVETAGQDEDGTALYYLEKVNEQQDDVRVQYAIGNKVFVSDEFSPSQVENLYEDFTISLYTGTVNINSVTAAVDGDPNSTTYAVLTGTGTLRVRAVENGDNRPDTNPVYGVTNEIPSTKLSSETAAIVAPQGTTYTLNHTTVPVDAKGVGLLFDDIYDKDNGNNERENALIEQTDDVLGAVVSGKTRHYQAKYLDLVDEDDGNAWVKADKDVTVYWAYPEGTNSSTQFKLYHFENLHRDDADEASSGYDIDDIMATTPESIDITNEDAGISFSVSPGGFSPFVLVWETGNPGGGGHTPSTPPDEPDTPDLNTVDHYSYIVGYPEDYRTGEPTEEHKELWPVKPQGNITRAEVATIFYRLLTDESRAEHWTQDNDYTDVNKEHWFNASVSTLSAMGIIAGYEDGTFRPNDPITRAEFAAIAVRFFEEKSVDYEMGSFIDIQGDEWYADAIQAAKEYGIVGGYPDGSFQPNDVIIRAEACSIVNRTLKRVPEKDHLLPESMMRVWPDNADVNAWFYEDMQEATSSHEYEWIEYQGETVEKWTGDLPEIDWDEVERELEVMHGIS